MGRTARGEGGRGRALLFLIPEELAFLKYLKDAKVPLNEYEFPDNKLAQIQAQLEKLIAKNYYLHQSARDAYRAYILAYNSHSMKHIFNVHRLDLQVGTTTPQPLPLDHITDSAVYPSSAGPVECQCFSSRSNAAEHVTVTGHGRTGQGSGVS